MSESHETRLKRLRMRATHRGIKEMDIICGAWAEARLTEADSNLLDIFEDLLEENDQDLYRWVSGQDEIPSQFNDLIVEMRELMDRRNNFA